MKKFLNSLLLVLVIVCTFVMVGCKKDKEPENPEEPPIVNPDEKDPEEKPVDPEKPTEPEKPAVEEVEYIITIDNLGVESQKYADGEVEINGIKYAYEEIGNYGNGIQMRAKTKPSKIKNVTEFSGIKEIKIVITEGKAGYSNEGALIIDSVDAEGKVLETVKLNTVKDQLEYTLTFKDPAKFIVFTHGIKFSSYYASITLKGTK